MNINITPLDFELLRVNDMAYDENLKRIRAEGRMEPVTRWATPLEGEDYPWERIYWFGREYAAVLLAQAFLKSLGHVYEVLWDNGHEWDSDIPFGYVILTDYEREEK
jgi:hypothetical protein